MSMNPQTVNLNPAALIAAAQKRSRFTPEKGGMLVVMFPGESMRCPVLKVLDEDTVIIKMDSAPMSRVHTFRFDVPYGVRRRVMDGKDIWEAQYENDFLAEQKRRHTAAVSAKPKVEPKVEAAKPEPEIVPEPPKPPAKKPSPSKAKVPAKKAAPKKVAPKRKQVAKAAAKGNRK
jgi:hypothetical protein